MTERPGYSNATTFHFLIWLGGIVFVSVAALWHFTAADLALQAGLPRSVAWLFPPVAATSVVTAGAIGYLRYVERSVWQDREQAA